MNPDKPSHSPASKGFPVRRGDEVEGRTLVNPKDPAFKGRFGLFYTRSLVAEFKKAEALAKEIRQEQPPRPYPDQYAVQVPETPKERQQMLATLMSMFLATLREMECPREILVAAEDAIADLMPPVSSPDFPAALTRRVDEKVNLVKGGFIEALAALVRQYSVFKDPAVLFFVVNELSRPAVDCENHLALLSRLPPEQWAQEVGRRTLELDRRWREKKNEKQGGKTPQPVSDLARSLHLAGGLMGVLERDIAEANAQCADADVRAAAERAAVEKAMAEELAARKEAVRQELEGKAAAERAAAERAAAQAEMAITPKVAICGERANKIRTLDDLEIAIAAISARPSRSPVDSKECDLLPIDLPRADLPQKELLEARSQVISKIYDLARVTLEALTDAKGGLRFKYEVPMQGGGSTGYSSADIDVLTDDIDRLVNICDQNFDEAIAHREFGIIALLRMVIDAINSNGDPQAVFVAFRNLGLRVSIGTQYPHGTAQIAKKEFITMDLTALPWEGKTVALSRKNVLQERVNENFKYPEYSRMTAKDMKIFQQRFGKQLGLLGAVMHKFSAALGIVHTSRYFNAMWQCKIMHELTNEAPFMTAPMIEALKALGAEFDDFVKKFAGKQGLPETKSAMEAVIERFATETMAPLIAAAKAANNAIILVADALASPGSVSEVQGILHKLASEQLSAFANELGGEKPETEVSEPPVDGKVIDDGKETTLVIDPEAVL